MGILLSASFIYSGSKVINRAGRLKEQPETIELGESATRASGKRSKEGLLKSQESLSQQVFWDLLVVDDRYIQFFVFMACTAKL